MHIHIITTGGTIDKVYFDARSTFAVGDPQIAEIFDAAGVTFEWTLETLLRKDSLDMNEEDRALIHKAILTSDAERIVVTHGTDTMALTAQLVEDQGHDGKTVVFVGSLSPARLKESDAEFNIGFAAAAVQILPPGVYVAMNGRIFSASTVTKNLTSNRFEGTPL